MTLNGVMAVTLRYFTEFGKPALQKTMCGGIYARDLYRFGGTLSLTQSICCILVSVQCRRKESSRSLSHLLMSFLSSLGFASLRMLCDINFFDRKKGSAVSSITVGEI